MGRTRKPSRSGSAARILALAAVLSLAASLPAVANPRQELEAARKRLKDLEVRITSQEGRVQGLADELQDTVSRLGHQEEEFADVRSDLRRTEAELARVQAEVDALTSRMRSRARDVYKRGPTPWLGIVLRSGSMSELSTTITYASRAVERDMRLLDGVQRAGDELRTRVASHEDLLKEESDALRSLRSEHRTVLRAFADQQKALEALSSARAEARELIATLRGRIKASELSSLERAAGRGTPITFGEWATHFLNALGAPTSRGNMVVVVAWQAAEYTKATWNPLATSYHMPGATVFNSHGVRNFVSLEQGVQASIATLRRPNFGYEAVLASLLAGSDAMTTARAINASHWCRGCTNGNYLIGLVPAVETYYERYASR